MTLSLRLLNTAPRQSAPIAYIEVPIACVRDNVTVLNHAGLRPSNAAEHHAVEHIVRVVEPSSNYVVPTSSDSERMATDGFILGSRAVLSQGVTHAPALFYKYFLGRGPQILVKRTGSVDVTVTVTSTLVSFNGTHIRWAGRSTRWIVKKINDADDGVVAQLLTSGAASLKTGTVSATSTGQYIYNASYYLVHAPNASTSDLDAARQTIKATVDVLSDGQKTSLVNWDLWVESYDSTESGFLCALYVDRKSFSGRTFTIRFPAIDLSGNITRSRTEVINAEPYLSESVQYDILEDQGDHVVDNLATGDYAWAIGLFSKTGSSQTAIVNSTTLSIGASSFSYSGKSLSDLVAEINETIGSSVQATVLSSRVGLLVANDLFSGSYTVKPSGVAVRLNMISTALIGPDTRIGAKLPHDTDIQRPWYPRISAGTLAEKLQLVGTSYGGDYGDLYGGSVLETYEYAIEEYEDQIFASDFGKPFRHVTREEPIIVNEKILRTRRWPIESLSNLRLSSGTTDISSKIEDVDLEQGFIFLSEFLDDYDNLSLDYLYVENCFIYEDLDLNPRDNPSIVGKYVGVYCVPKRIGNNIWTASRTVYHAISDDAQYLEDILASVEFIQSSSNTFSSIKVNPVLIGVYQVVENASPSDAIIRPIGKLGGGLREDTTAKEEANFLYDIGRFDGVPFEGHGAIIVEVPESIVAASDNPPFVLDPSKSDSPFMDPSGQYKLKDIQDIANRWAAMGNAALIEVDPNV